MVHTVRDVMKKRRFVLAWLLASALILGGISGALALTEAMYQWQWDAWTPSRDDPLELDVGDPAPDFTLRDLEGKPFHLTEETAKRPIVVEVGSFT
jgi:cytochrome oxidase Cu insertion factor (SCO1/SenC/PrrC family)